MNSSVCVDASLVIRSLVPGPHTQKSVSLLRNWHEAYVDLIAPSLIVYEVTSTLRRLVFFGEISENRGEDLLARFLMMPLRLSHRPGTLRLAWQFAQRFKVSRVYDMSYVALAHEHKCDLWKDDERLYNLARAEFSWVQSVGAEST